MTDSQIPEELRYTGGTRVDPQDRSVDRPYRCHRLRAAGTQRRRSCSCRRRHRRRIGESFAEVESTKSVSDIYGPIDGTVSAANDALEASPELVNSDPYGDGWLCEITLPDGADVDAVLGGLLDAAGYRDAISD